jgi:hypothetical protein
LRLFEERARGDNGQAALIRYIALLGPGGCGRGGGCDCFKERWISCLMFQDRSGSSDEEEIELRGGTVGTCSFLEDSRSCTIEDSAREVMRRIGVLVTKQVVLQAPQFHQSERFLSPGCTRQCNEAMSPRNGYDDISQQLELVSVFSLAQPVNAVKDDPTRQYAV